jgi:hypothetical protein
MTTGVTRDQKVAAPTSVARKGDEDAIRRALANLLG